MGNSDWVEYKIQVRERLREFALRILKLSELMPENTRGKVLNYQFTKSATSMYANYRAALRGRSKAEIFSKLQSLWKKQMKLKCGSTSLLPQN